MRHRIFLHLTWTTRDRAALIDLPRAEFLGRHLVTVSQQERAQIWALGIVSTHVHLLLRADPAIRLSPLIQRYKGASSALIARERIGQTRAELRWAKGYSLESVSPRAVEAVRDYVDDQARRHPAEAIAGLNLNEWKAAADEALASDRDNGPARRGDGGNASLQRYRAEPRL